MTATKISYGVIGILATQLLLGCQKTEEVSDPMPMQVNLPASLDHPSELVGSWQEAKGRNGVVINADGSCEITTKVTIGANVTKGEAKSFDQKTPCKWGTKDGKFYFSEMKDMPNLSYEYKIEAGKLVMTSPGTKLTYTKEKA